MEPPRRYTRRDALGVLASGGAFGLSRARLGARAGQSASLDGGQSTDTLLATALERNDTAVQSLLQTQVTDPASPFRGSVPDQFGLHSAGSAGGVSETLAASFVHPRSRFHHDIVLLERIRLAAGFLERAQSPQGQHRSAHDEFQLASRHGIRGPQRRDGGGNRPAARRPGDCGHASTVPGEGGGGHGRRWRPHAESSVGRQFRARADQRALSRCAFRAPDRRVAGRGHRHRPRRPVHRAQHAHLQHRHRPCAGRDGGEAEAAGAARAGPPEPARR